MTAPEKPVYREPQSRTFTVWLPIELMNYVEEVADEVGADSRNRSLRNIVEEHRDRRNKRLARAKR